MTRGRIPLLPLILLATSLLTRGAAVAAAPAEAAGAETIEDGVARVVVGILSYSRWPKPPNPVRLCVLGKPDYAGTLIERTPALPGKPLAVHTLPIDDAAVTTLCDAVYIGASSPGQLQSLYARIVGHPIVSIIEDDPECAVGSMFCLNVDQDQVAFKVNLDSVARSGVRVHPSVLQLGRRKPR
jgi:hypothetical protein